MARYTLGSSCLIDNETNKLIPKDNRNRHYQEFLNWVLAGNIPDPMTDAQKAVYE